LLDDIKDLQSSTKEEDGQSRRRSRVYDYLLDLSDSHCIRYTIKDKAYEDPQVFFQTLDDIYGYESLNVKFEGLKITTGGQIIVPYDGSTRIYIIDCYSTEDWSIPIEETQGALAAVISGATSHYEVQIRDFVTDEYVHFDPFAHPKSFDLTDGKRRDTWLTGTFSKNGFQDGRPPRYLVYFSKQEIDEIIAQTNVQQPPPQPLPDTPTEAEVKALAKDLHNTSGGKIIATALGLKPDTTQWEENLDELRGTLYIGHMKDNTDRMAALRRAYKAAENWLKAGADSEERKNLEQDIAIYASRAALGANRYPAGAAVSEKTKQQMNNWPGGPLLYLPKDKDDRKRMIVMLERPNDTEENQLANAIDASRLRLFQYK
jgi:hypothetical protein